MKKSRLFITNGNREQTWAGLGAWGGNIALMYSELMSVHSSTNFFLSGVMKCFQGALKMVGEATKFGLRRPRYDQN